MNAYLSTLAAAVSVGQHIVLSQPRPNKGPELHFYRVTGIDGVRVSVEPVGRHLLWGVRDWDLPNYSQSAGDQVASDELSRRQDCGIAIGGLRDLAHLAGRDSPACADGSARRGGAWVRSRQPTLLRSGPRRWAVRAWTVAMKSCAATSYAAQNSSESAIIRRSKGVLESGGS